MSDASIPKKDLGETPILPNINTLHTIQEQASKIGLSIGGIHITNPTKKQQEDIFAEAIKKEYNDANMYQ